MLHRKTIWLVAIVFSLVIPSCTRLEKPPQDVPLLGTEKLASSNSIPLEWGKLVSVTTLPGAPETFQLCLQDENGTIRMALYSLRNRFLNANAVVIPRK